MGKKKTFGSYSEPLLFMQAKYRVMGYQDNIFSCFPMCSVALVKCLDLFLLTIGPA